jgi:hypothetical protein
VLCVRERWYGFNREEEKDWHLKKTGGQGDWVEG